MEFVSRKSLVYLSCGRNHLFPYESHRFKQHIIYLLTNNKSNLVNAQINGSIFHNVNVNRNTTIAKKFDNDAARLDWLCNLPPNFIMPINDRGSSDEGAELLEQATQGRDKRSHCNYSTLPLHLVSSAWRPIASKHDNNIEIGDTCQKKLQLKNRQSFCQSKFSVWALHLSRAPSTQSNGNKANGACRLL